MKVYDGKEETAQLLWYFRESTKEWVLELALRIEGEYDATIRFVGATPKEALQAFLEHQAKGGM